MMGLTLAERRAVTEATAIRYTLASKRGKSRILDELCANTGWHRNHARKALKSALQPKIVTPRSPRPMKYGPNVIAALTVCWTVLGMPAGKRLAPVLGELVAVLRHFGELVIDEDTAELLVSMSAATIDRRLANQRAKYRLKGRVCTKPGSLLKSQIPVRTWADWDDARPGFVEIDLVGHDGGNPAGPHAFTLTVTDIATGWTEVRTVRNKAARHVFAALIEIQATLPFPLLGIDSDNGSEFINEHLLAWCLQQQITFTRSRPQNKNDGCHVEQKNWDITRRTVGYWRYDTPGEIELLNRIWPVLSPLINLFTPQQKLQSKTRVGAKVSKRYDRAQTPYQRLLTHAATNPAVLDQADTRRLATLLEDTNPAAARRDIARLCAALLERVRRKTVTRRAKTNRAYLSGSKTRRADGSLIISTPKRAKPHESTTQHKRAS